MSKAAPPAPGCLRSPSVHQPGPRPAAPPASSPEPLGLPQPSSAQAESFPSCPRAPARLGAQTGRTQQRGPGPQAHPSSEALPPKGRKLPPQGGTSGDSLTRREVSPARCLCPGENRTRVSPGRGGMTSLRSRTSYLGEPSPGGELPWPWKQELSEGGLLDLPEAPTSWERFTVSPAGMVCPPGGALTWGGPHLGGPHLGGPSPGRDLTGTLPGGKLSRLRRQL